jgi:hypothetical protein
MFSCDCDEKIFQTLPGQGWRVLNKWNMQPQDYAEGYPDHTLEPVIAWVTARVQRERPRDGFKFEDIIVAPLVRFPDGNELTLLDSNSPGAPACVYLAPGEELSQLHFDQLGYRAYAKAVTLG